MSKVVQPETLSQPMLDAFKREILKQLEDHLLDIARPIIKEKVVKAMEELELRIMAARDLQYDEIIIKLTAQFKD